MQCGFGQKGSTSEPVAFLIHIFLALDKYDKTLAISLDSTNAFDKAKLISMFIQLTEKFMF